MTLKLEFGSNLHDLTIVARRPEPVLSIDGIPHGIANLPPASIARDGNQVWVHLDGRTHVITLIDPLDAAAAKGAGSDEIRAPMPGVVLAITASAGQHVSKGDVVAVIESMKMEMNLIAERDGTLAEILRTTGDTFDKGGVIARLVPQEESE